MCRISFPGAVDPARPVRKFKPVMKAARTILLATGFSGGVAAALLVLALVLGWEVHSLRTRLAEAQTQLRVAAAELEHWRSQQQLAESRQAEHQRKLEALETELAALRENRTTNPPAFGATRVHVFSQGRYLGTGQLATGERRTEPELTVHLNAPGAGSADESTPATAVAVTAFSVAHHYPGWPWLWTLGWVVGEPTNNAGPPAGRDVNPAPPVPPAVDPAPPQMPRVSARGVWPSGLRAFRTTGMRTVPRPGQSLPEAQVSLPVTGPSVSTPRPVPEAGRMVPLGRRLAERPVVRR